MMESGRKRVEQKGRFTITEIIPGSPYSPRVSSPTFQDDEVSVSDFPASTDAPVSTGSSGEVAIQPQPQLKLMESNVIEKIAVNGVMEPALTMDLPPETHTQPPETVLVPPAPIEANLATGIAQETEASTGDSVSEVSTATTASATAAPGSPSRKYSSPKKTVQRARRVKRRGRFTIIELASDSPTSRKNADDLYDHRFVTTTSIGGTSVESAPQLNTQLSRSSDNLERRSKPKRATRSMPRLRQTSSSTRRYRRRSESPTRAFSESVNIVDPSVNQQQQQEATAYTQLKALSVAESLDPLTNGAMTTAIAASASATITTSTSNAGSMTSVAIQDCETAVTITPPTSVRPVTPSSQLMKVSETNGSVVNLPQTSVTISTAQFLQQQQTIASLIRQQHDLKQVINVLQEQQQQLMTIPTQINELKRQRANLNNGETRDDEMRGLYKKVDKLTQANESLHSLINAAEREARHRTLEIECLSEENDELRHRCGQLETRYMDERKQSFVLEEEVQRLRMLSLTLQEQQLRQQQQQSQILSSSAAV
ncbi:hypothetical protein JG687_00008394 [Phytophthora cactorum]|uniref:Uncharacterized protein n=1 Tax=Phytophthora cactorum TaxID=29920 RepID=A0A329T5C0_9STRA|nr:hypothetical protein Pcac1_g2014 [Phytophthora cactorum]KAG2818792.1 hypothetical protein PC112_g12460 [Phytophthora cactorum]KAG2820903.1 hypothetical protein PC111_g11258 [Phytophthora cactorum]KAG2854796.1 hypothetical protein PC113_g12997 [Phytophthora cactorum]KAG2913718.1 hypothetical protein PC115_g11917 [Phytophthora cactorum]